MTPQERLDRLRQMLAQVAPQETLESIPTPGSGLESATGEPDPAAEGVLKLQEQREHEITAPELDALEAIVMPTMRPVVFVRNGTYDDLREDPWLHLNEQAIRDRLTPALAAVGRIDLPNSPAIPFGGTGFVVGRNLIMTNRHVARLFSDGLGVRGLRYLRGDAALDFKREVGMGPDEGTPIEVISVEMVHPFWDMALLKVEGLEGVEPLSLSSARIDDAVGKEVIAVGYPAMDQRNDMALQNRIFERVFNVKRVHPGKLRRREKIRSFENVVDAITHDSSTLGGNSGSALIRIDTGQVVGLHFAGIYLKANYAVPAFELARDSRVVARKLNFDGSVPPTNEWEPAWRSADGDEAPAALPPAPAPAPVLASPPPQTSAPVNTAPAASPLAMSFTIPLEFSISVGAPVAKSSTQPSATSEATAVAEAMEAMKTPIIFPDLESRTGYDPNFLELDGGEVAPLPKVTREGKRVAAKLADGGIVLNYHKFSVVMNKHRRLALFTASNVDWRKAMRTVNGKKPSRKELTGLGPNDIERWETDARIDEEDQLPDIFFTKDQGSFDKGHLVRRDDVAWGDSFEDMQMANGDTYHTTNCSPQVSSFNQSVRGQENWGDLETLIEKETKLEKAIVFSGPVLADDDPVFEGVDANRSKIKVQIPRSFWKIIVVKGEAGAEAYGFVLKQDLSDVTLEAFNIPSVWRVHTKPVIEIEALLNGLAKLPWLIAHDHTPGAGRARGASA